MINNFLGIKLQKLSLLEKMWLLAPLVIWFSYQPLLSLWQDNTAYYELSIPLIYLVLLGVVGVPAIWRARQMLAKQGVVWLTSAFVGYGLLSLLWTPNALRGILTIGIVGLLFLVFLAALAEQARLRRLIPILARLLIGSAVIMSLLAFVQVFAGIWLSRSEALLCAGCIADQFGFVRPNVFAIEPQFFGSLLLAPLLILLSMIVKDDRSKYAICSFLLLSTALFLTLSRGAIFAFAIGALVLFVMHYRKWAAVMRSVSILALAFATTLLIQGAAAAVNPRLDTRFMGAISASIEQLSLGLIDIPVEPQAPRTGDEKTLPAYDGYVEESTNVRLSLSSLALGTWSDTPARIAFGVGAGGAGIAMHERYVNQVGTREIVQNQYIEVLLEYGLVGFALFTAVIVGFVYRTRRDWLAWALMAAYLVQWSFFSGYPNALHIYLVLIAIFAANKQVLSSGRRVGAVQT